MPKKDRPVLLSEDDLALLYLRFEKHPLEAFRSGWNYMNPVKKPEAFLLPPLGVFDPSPAISDDTREELETKAWQGDLNALATLIRQDPRYIGCPWTLAVTARLREAALARTPEEREDADDRLRKLAQAWIAVDRRGLHFSEPPAWQVALIGDGLMKAYTEAMAHPPLVFSDDSPDWVEQIRERESRPVRLREALTRAEETFRRCVGAAMRKHPDQQWLDWFKEDLEHLLRGDGRRTRKMVVTDRLAIVFDLKHKEGWKLERAKTLWEQGRPWWRAKKGKKAKSK